MITSKCHRITTILRLVIWQKFQTCVLYVNHRIDNQTDNNFELDDDVDVDKLWAQASLCPSLQYSSQNYQIQVPTKPHLGFRFLQFQLENYIQYPDSAKIYLIET